MATTQTFAPEFAGTQACRDGLPLQYQKQKDILQPEGSEDILLLLLYASES
ncbi:hypothetical protein NLX78_01575 [Paenibacillus sp. Lou8.1]|uniref:hypothetical protein n=1 Tax=Paenibacillus sp. Lou8.1 TaxID=2962041 RepID=UPI0020B6BBF1|nr:hypothetical protein [Paenibacillus sp. Lou8.1]MCP3805911.1 hypothetical protein [Paenibacillus sp. Lou8.1]